jgi:hypothetical protein
MPDREQNADSINRVLKNYAELVVENKKILKW